jgi:hypothetical protein
MLTFDEPSHTYFWQGKPVPNVTRVLQPLVDLSRIPAAALEIARQKGEHVHKMVELHATGDLEEHSLPEWMRPVYEEWLRFVSETGFEVIYSERRLYHPLYGYATTPDLKARIRAQEGPGIIEIKRSFLAGDVIGFQTAAQAEADKANSTGEKIRWRATLKLHEDHRYRLEPLENKNDFSHFLTCLAFHNLKRRYNP